MGKVINFKSKCYPVQPEFCRIDKHNYPKTNKITKVQKYHDSQSSDFGKLYKQDRREIEDEEKDYYM